MISKWFYNQLQKWTPFSVLVIIVGCACIFIICFDVVRGTSIQPFIASILSILLGGTGTASLFQHGVNVTNGVAAKTAAETILQATNQVNGGNKPS